MARIPARTAPVAVLAAVGGVLALVACGSQGHAAAQPMQ